MVPFYRYCYFTDPDTQKVGMAYPDERGGFLSIGSSLRFRLAGKRAGVDLRMPSIRALHYKNMVRSKYYKIHHSQIKYLELYLME